MFTYAQKPAKSTVVPAGGILQRKCDKCRKKKATLQHYAADPTLGMVSPVVHEMLRSPNQPLDEKTRAFMEPRPRHDFSHIPLYPKSQARIQAKLTVNAPGDIYEHEADRIADQMMATPAYTAVSGAPPHIQRFVGQPSRQMEAAPASVDQALVSPGKPLEPALRQDMEQRFSHDFSRVRVHTDAAAEQSARDVNARAYTVGRDIVFGAGRFAPRTHEGQRLIAHELTHVVQQRLGAYAELQRSSLRDFNDKNQMHDPSMLTDAQIEATYEFKSYTDEKLPWRWKYHMTREEALLACRLILRHLREGEHVDWKLNAADFMNRARKQLRTLRETEKLEGKLTHVHQKPIYLEGAEAAFDEFVDPNADWLKTTYPEGSDFIKWLLADGPEPTDTSRMNCWDMVLFGAYRASVMSKAKIKKMYKEAGEKWQKSGMLIGPIRVLEEELCGAESNLTFSIFSGQSSPFGPVMLFPDPLPGDIITFDAYETTVAISLGTKTKFGLHNILSLHTASGHVETTTIEYLMPSFLWPPLTGKVAIELPITAKLCRDPWRGK